VILSAYNNITPAQDGTYSSGIGSRTGTPPIFHTPIGAAMEACSSSVSPSENGVGRHFKYPDVCAFRSYFTAPAAAINSSSVVNVLPPFLLINAAA
jgi:hypothetical protein